QSAFKTYKSGDPIQLDADGTDPSMRVTLTGTPNVNDSFVFAQGRLEYGSSYPSTNGGNAKVNDIQVIDPTRASYGDDYTIEFNKVGPNEFEYDVLKAGTPPTTIVDDRKYVSGEPIVMGDQDKASVSVTIQGTPADGDTIDVSKDQ